MKKRQFVKLYDQYAPRIYRFICLKIESLQDSEDLTSEVFFRFWRKLADKSNKIDNPRAFLYRIANNLITDFYRRKPRADLVIDPAENSILMEIPDKTDLNQKTNLDLDMEQVKKALKQLKNEYQDVIIWHYLDELSSKEISQITGKSEGAVRVLLHRALGTLKEKM